MIVIQNLSKQFRHKNQVYQALDKVSLDIAEGDIVGIIGRSGAGKSTLIRCVNMLERPDEGAVMIHGRNLATCTPKQLADERKKIGMIFQHFNLLSSRTVFDNVALPLELDKTDKATIHRKVTALLEVVGLQNKADEYPRSLSGGQKQRVAIARALANDPHLLLCDEATSALDPETTQSILQLLRDINRRLNITILLITHEMHVVKSICNHVAVIDQGKLVAQGTLETLLKESQHPVIQQFIHTQAMSLPPDIYNTLQPEYTPGLHPLVEIELEGNVAFDSLVNTFHSQYHLPYKLIKADIEYLGSTNFGRVLLHLQGTDDSNRNALLYLNSHHIKNTIRGYA
ncbi:D-methionine transport system ATP-binding protein [Filimonas zeae]|uniref:Cell division ATP-binding protein FtsE n=1 Tax=Filimonas zeae TaxID=1737353 RepID=A0A917IZM1_9BACT|nr:ATP-binding cassette domain-containing protein [Filimonas zeae]MDR6340206.1 D-methionine transport system ATP-binding protein [Filimonas zeae]GGH71653.1 methionine import ATP-binding protein MetN [Filimonas zeae]